MNTNMNSGNQNPGNSSVCPGSATTRRVQRRVFDSVKVISREEFREQLRDTSSIQRQDKRAPRTKAAMRCQSYDILENYFSTPGRKLSGKPLTKLFASRLHTFNRSSKAETTPVSSIPNDGAIAPLGFDLRTPATRDLIGMIPDTCPNLPPFPKRNPADVRKSYVKKLPKKSVAPAPSFSLSSSQPSTRTSPGARNIVTSATSHSLNSTSPQRSNQNANAQVALINQHGQINTEHSIDSSVVLKDDFVKIVEIPQDNSTLAVDDYGLVITDTMNTEAQFENPETEMTEVEITTSGMILCSSNDDLKDVIVMGENGESYRLVASNDGSLLLIADSKVQ